jgi:phosphoribosylformylglycinamidine synthase
VRIGVVTFPGSLDDVDAIRAVRLAGGEPVWLWHADPDLRGVDAVILPGGFSYGDYLRCGAIARFTPVMESVAGAARAGVPVLGICNGFQILCEAHLLPGALIRNRHLHFRNRDQRLRIESAATRWTSGYGVGQEILIPVKSGEGRYVADPATLDELEATGRVVARYVVGNAGGGAPRGYRVVGGSEDIGGDAGGGAPRGYRVVGGSEDIGGDAGGGAPRGSGAPRGYGNPNGSLGDIAAIANEAGNVVGILPHPEHAVDPLTGPSTDGLGMFSSVLKHLAGAGLAHSSPETPT